jgi:hypothetical protein
MSPRAPITLRYRIDAKNQTTIDLSGFGQPAQEQSLGLTVWVVVSLQDTTGGRALHVVVDSAKYEGTLPIGQESVDSARGGTIHGVVDPAGRVKNLTVTPNASVFMAQIEAVMAGFFPRVKPGAKTGDKWVDTMEVTNSAGGANTKTQRISNYTLGARETVSGLPAMRLNSVYTSTMSGTLENQMGTVEVEGTGTGTGFYLVGTDGSSLGSGTTTNLDQKVKMAMAPGPIPVKVAQTLTVTLLK